MQDNVMLLWCHHKGTFSLSLCYIVLWSTHLSFFRLITCQLVAVSDPVVIVHMSCGIAVSRFAYHVLPTKGREKTFTTAQLPLSFFFLCSAVVCFLVKKVADPHISFVHPLLLKAWCNLKTVNDVFSIFACATTAK